MGMRRDLACLEFGRCEKRDCGRVEALDAGLVEALDAGRWSVVGVRVVVRDGGLDDKLEGGRLLLPWLLAERLELLEGIMCTEEHGSYEHGNMIHFARKLDQVTPSRFFYHLL